MTLAVVVAACLLSSAFAHTCLLHPLQRGGAPGATKMPADKVCGKTTGPCGGAPMGKPSMMVKAGSTVEINWVKNLNHYNPTAPGKKAKNHVCVILCHFVVGGGGVPHNVVSLFWVAHHPPRPPVFNEPQATLACSVSTRACAL